MAQKRKKKAPRRRIPEHVKRFARCVGVRGAPVLLDCYRTSPSRAAYVHCMAKNYLPIVAECARETYGKPPPKRLPMKNPARRRNRHRRLFGAAAQAHAKALAKKKKARDRRVRQSGRPAHGRPHRTNPARCAPRRRRRALSSLRRRRNPSYARAVLENPGGSMKRRSRRRRHHARRHHAPRRHHAHSRRLAPRRHHRRHGRRRNPGIPDWAYAAGGGALGLGALFSLSKFSQGAAILADANKKMAAEAVIAAAAVFAAKKKVIPSSVAAGVVGAMIFCAGYDYLSTKLGSAFGYNLQLSPISTSGGTSPAPAGSGVSAVRNVRQIRAVHHDGMGAVGAVNGYGLPSRYAANGYTPIG